MLASLNPYLQKEFWKNLFREPSMVWGLRMAISVCLSVLYGIFLRPGPEDFWAGIAAECISFIQLSGVFAQRIRLLLSGAVLTILFCALGSWAGNIVSLTLLGMFVIGVLCALFKNLGERGITLAISIYIFYIVTSAYPIETWDALWLRLHYVSVGAGITIIVGLISSLFVQKNQPYRYKLADVWKHLSDFSEVLAKGWNGKEIRSSVRALYKEEQNLQVAVNAMNELFDGENVLPEQEYESLNYIRRRLNIIKNIFSQLNELLEPIHRHSLDKLSQIKLYSILRALATLGYRKQKYLLHNRNEEKLLIESRLHRLKELTTQFQEHIQEVELAPEVRNSMLRIIVTIERLINIAEGASPDVKELQGVRNYKVYSFAQTLSILHPKYLTSNLKQIFRLNNQTITYAIRIGLTTLLAAIIAWLFFNPNSILKDWLVAQKLDTLLFFKDHGYWIPFTAIIVAQPYIGATFKKGLQRSLGTIIGVLIGWLLLQLPFPFMGRLLIIAISNMLLIYFIDKEYSVATIFITLSLVGIMAIENNFSTELLLNRITCTVIGSFIAIFGGFLLLPSWDKDLLPQYVGQSISNNYKYFQQIFYNQLATGGIAKFQSQAEQANHNAFDSFIRYMKEPQLSRSKKSYFGFYYFITHSLRITREINNFRSETDQEDTPSPYDQDEIKQRIYQCEDLFREILMLLQLQIPEALQNNTLHILPNHGLYNKPISDTQTVYIKKLLIELKAIRSLLNSASFLSVLKSK